jgi:hypothetical protein
VRAFCRYDGGNALVGELARGMNAPIRNNTEVREAPPDVDAYDGPLKAHDAMRDYLALVEKLKAAP